MSKESTISFTIVFALVILMFTGMYYGFKWTGDDLIELKKHCPNGTKLTDYTFFNAEYNNITVIHNIECDKKVMDYKVKLTPYWECQNYNKWDKCTYSITIFNGTKITPTVQEVSNE